MKMRVFLKLCLCFLFISIPLGLKSSDYVRYKLVQTGNNGGNLIKSVKVNNDLSLSIRVYYGVTSIRIDYYQDGMKRETKTYNKYNYGEEIFVPIALGNTLMISARYTASNSDSNESIIQGENYHVIIYDIVSNDI